MTIGSAVGVLAVWPGRRTDSPLVLGACVLIGVAMSATLYPPAFAALTHWGGERRVRALTAVTLVGGLASTVFAPLTAVLESSGSWRSAYAILAAPLAAHHRVALARAPPPLDAPLATDPRDVGAPGADRATRLLETDTSSLWSRR